MASQDFVGGRNRHRTLNFQCPQCLQRGIEHHHCHCETPQKQPAPHAGRLLRDGDTCEALCGVCGWEGTWPTLPDGTPEGLRDTAQQWLDLGHLPTEALYLAWMWLDPTDPMARFAGPNAVNKAGETFIDLVALLVKADRIGCGDDPLRTVEDILERLKTPERREEDRSDNRASPPKKKTETGTAAG